MLPRGWTEASLPAIVRAGLAEARAGRGPAVAWLAAATDEATIVASRELLASAACGAELAGWLVGIAMSVDRHRFLVEPAQQRTDALPFVLAAFALAVREQVPVTRKHWGTMEALALRCQELPPELAPVIALGVQHQQHSVREIARRLAILAGTPARLAIEVALPTAESKVHDRWLRAALDAIERAQTTAPATPMLARLLAAWRATRDPALEASIAVLGARAAELRGPLPDDEAAWLACARLGDPEDLDRLLDASWHVDDADLRARTAALAMLPADPRLVRLVELARVHAWSRDGHAAVAELLALRACAGIARELADFAGPHAPLYDAVVRAAAVAAAPRAADPALLAAAATELAPLRALAELWRAHEAAPGDLALRGVLADALTACGDPRGELIALQTAIADGVADDRAEARVARLLTAHRAAWQHLPGIRGHAEIVRGFPVAAMCDTNPGDLRAAMDRRAWVTLERLSLACAVPVAPLVRRMPLLHALEVAYGESLDGLAEAGPHPQLRAIGAPTPWIPDRAAFPNLELLAIHIPNQTPVHEHLVRAERLGVRELYVRTVYNLAPFAAARASGPPLVVVGMDYARIGLPARGDRAMLDLPGVIYASLLLPQLRALRDHQITQISLRVGSGYPEQLAELLDGLAAAFALDRDGPALDPPRFV